MDGLSCEFNCFHKNKFTLPFFQTESKSGAKSGLIGKFYLALGGAHNISNALAVIAMGLELGIDLEVIKKALANYKGVGRRIEIKFQDKELIVIDDYAHHPTEIKATLSAIRNLKFKKTIVVFQPHRYTRTKLLLDEFAKCFDLADEVVITDIYPAGEPPLEGVTAERMKDKIKEHSPAKKIVFVPKDDIINYVIKAAGSGDLIITLGAGDITKICDELVERIKR
jgi:UDP-N-acetylmuramate--alanine ligase